jgi:hypothetical protein
MLVASVTDGQREAYVAGYAAGAATEPPQTGQIAQPDVGDRDINHLASTTSA